MNFFNKPKSNPTIFPPPKQTQHQFNLQETFTAFQHNISSVINQIAQNTSSLKTHLQSALAPSPGPPAWARIAASPGLRRPGGRAPPAPAAGLSTEAIEERLAGVPVYALSNANEEFVLVSGVSTDKSLGLFCFNKEDAEAILDQIATLDPTMQSGSKVVTVALNKVFQLKVNGVAFRLIPDVAEVKHAIKERENAGLPNEGFWGVPVFQAKSLILRSQNKSYRPAFFKKEDLEKSLLRASREQGRLNPSFRKGEIEVSVLEDVIKGMKESSSKWNDVVFIPPGFDISAGSSISDK